jgi:hypothetical protein
MAYKNRDKLIKLPCEHQYHQACVAKWLQINKAIYLLFKFLNMCSVIREKKNKCSMLLDEKTVYIMILASIFPGTFVVTMTVIRLLELIFIQVDISRL